MRRPLYLVLCSLPFCAVLIPLLLSCNSAASGTIQIITGEETDTFTQTPVPTQIIVQVEEDGGAPTTLATAPYPTDTIDLGNQDQDAVASLGVEATDSNGNELIYGASIALQYGALDGETLPIFVQRVGQNARLSNFPSGDTRQAPLLSILSDRFLIVSGGQESATSLTTEIYDFAQFNLLTPAPTMPIVPASIAVVSTIGLIIDAAGDPGWYYDYSGSTSNYSFSAPTDPTNNFTLADVAGGQAIYDPTDGYVFIVGATRTTGTPTQAVLMINTTDTSNSTYETGNLSWVSLADARLGASATYVAAQGLVVAGGSATAPGVEVIGPSATAGSELTYPPDPSSGAGMTLLDLDQSGTILLAGGLLPGGADAGVRTITLGCGTGCAPTYWGPNNGALPVPVTLAFAFPLSPAYAFLVGSEPSTSQAPGLTHTFTLTTAGATEVPTKVAHTNASAIESPMGSSVIFYGGANGEIESFTPAPQGLVADAGVDGG